MNHEAALTNYVEKLNTHSWEQIAQCVTEDAVFIFTEDTFVGKAAAKTALEKTFKLIENEVFSRRDIVWTVATNDVATCRYEFGWKGLISGQEAPAADAAPPSYARSMAVGSSRMSIWDLILGNSALFARKQLRVASL